MGLCSSTKKKLDELQNFFKDKEKVLVAFSGGVDSSVVTALANIQSDTIAVTVNSIIFPPWELDNSKKIAEEIGVKHIIMHTNKLGRSVAENNPKRCYYCKKELIAIFKKVAQKEARIIVDGTNADDLKSYRPGALALKEGDLYSPLAIVGLKKREVREIAIHLGLSNADKPSMACLASRFPYGQKLTHEGIERVAKAEKYIMDLLKVRQIRVRNHGNIARIELGSKERKLLYNEDLMDKIVKELKYLGFNYVTMDLQGYRSGSMDEVL